jgi:hypothetical protein
MCFGIRSHAQTNINIVEAFGLEQDIVMLENRITRLIKKEPKIAHIQGLRQFHMLWFNTQDHSNEFPTKDEYLDHSFLYQLHPDYFTLRSKRYLDTITLITDSEGNIVANGDAIAVRVFHNYSNTDYEKLAKMLFNQEFDSILILGGKYTLGYYIGIKGNSLYGIHSTLTDVTIYPWDEFMECCLDKWEFHMNSGPASGADIDSSNRGSMTQEQIRNQPGLGGDPAKDGIEDYRLWNGYTLASGRPVVRGNISDIVPNMQNDGRVSITLRKNGSYGHTVVMQRIEQKTVTRINGTIASQKLFYYVMDPANGGGFVQIPSKSLHNANIFTIWRH